MSHRFIYFIILNVIFVNELLGDKMSKASKGSSVSSDEEILERSPKKGSLAKCHELSFSEDDYKMLNFSGLLAINETTKKLVPGGFEEEVPVLFRRIKTLVESNNSSMDKVESLKFRMVDLTWNYIVNDQIRKYFKYPYPGSTLIEIDHVLPMNASLDVEVIAHSPLPSKGYDKKALRGRNLDRKNTEYEYQLHEIPDEIVCATKGTKGTKVTKGTTKSKNVEADDTKLKSFYRSMKQNKYGIHVYGVFGLDEKTNKTVSGGIEKETDMTFQHIKSILDKYGTSFQRVATLKIFVKDKSHHPMIEEILKKHVEPHDLPLRSLIETQNLPADVQIECEFVAFTIKKLERHMIFDL